MNINNKKFSKVKKDDIDYFGIKFTKIIQDVQILKIGF